MSSLKNLCKPDCIPNTNYLTIFINTTTPFANLKWSTNESYYLNISTNCKRVYLYIYILSFDNNSLCNANSFLADQITVKITAKTVYGARNGLETLRQLITAHGPESSDKTLVIAEEVEIMDEPMYTHRGFMLDTSRNYFPLSSIKRTIDAMGHSKLNVFHWHATDSHSFPLYLPSVPQMAM